ncbi:tetratricopeptide repeat protein [Polynucleobacter sp. AP-Kaivos-20-H2]|uniref:tetratricopeptide repeat protein n=1 Tax=Polynucleobacter sp. AP-Kaivos-20-H2 TaxID=2689104 RepID=UPI001C0B5D8D|nr:sel1 repeat family protein [Polynucleobacter sp. AP-Kaivos-20-H2]MBU3604342.1 sel1 repeat family protein [Polynucleobacter sp. AP-Kaivos-20-H2]
MASREFLKILSSARLGDVLAQQKLAEAYLTGAFKTPIQPSNALIWLEKSYLSAKSQAPNTQSTSQPENHSILSLMANIPLAETFYSPAFQFGWESFWRLTEAQDESNNALAAKWQLANLLINPSNQELQIQLMDWVKKQSSSLSEKFSGQDFNALQKRARQYLKELADGNSTFATQAKELLIKLQPKNEALSSLWNVWLEDRNEDALTQAAELGLTVAKLTLGLRLAQLDGAAETKSNASLKKAAHWIELAAKDGDRDAWYALGEIYRRPQFSGYSATESDRCFDRAADLGHPQAQLRKGANLWRKRERNEEKVRGLQASYWIWQAQQQGVAKAKELLGKILVSCPNPKRNDWYELAQYADQAINHHAEHKLDEDWLLLCHRLIIANQFNFSKAELLLSEVGQLQHEHCVVVDIRWELPKILPRLIQIETIQQRRALLAAGKAFVGVEPEIEGNLRQRRYRFDQVTNWLISAFSKNTKNQSDPELA